MKHYRGNVEGEGWQSGERRQPHVEHDIMAASDRRDIVDAEASPAREMVHRDSGDTWYRPGSRARRHDAVGPIRLSRAVTSRLGDSRNRPT